MSARNLLLALVILVPILVDCQFLVQWTLKRKACIPGRNDESYISVPSLGHCKNLCERKNWCRSVEYHTNGGSCTISSAHSSSAQLQQPCSKPRITYAEITGSNDDVREGGQGGGSNSGSGRCSRHSDCGKNRLCALGLCVEKVVDPCKSAGCGQGAVCHVSKGKAECLCPINTQGNPHIQCLRIMGCNDNSQCENNKICEKRRCMNPCDVISCGQGARCQTSGRKGRIPQCICPDNTQRDPRVQCHPKQDSNLDLRGGNQGGTVMIPGPSICQFPFTYKGTTFSACTRESDPEGKLWCSTKTDGRKNHQRGNWKHCTECTSDTNCRDNKVCRSGSCVNLCDLAKCGQGATCQLIHRRPQCMCPDNTRVNEQVQCRPIQGPSDCQFPFTYKGTTFSACTRESDPEGKLWCSTKTDGQKNHQKGNWKHCTGCESAECAAGTNCMISQGRPHCIDNEPIQNPANIDDRTIIGNSAANNQANLQFTKPPPSATPNDAHGQESTRHAGCYSLPDPGECRGAFPRFYYNQQTNQCDCFLFGGCDEERVKFTWLTFEECLGTCVPGNRAKGPGCQRVTLEEVTRFIENEQKIF